MSFNGTNSLSGTRHGRDPAPQVRPAGLTGRRDHGIFDIEARPDTPENIKPFRKSAMTTVGRTVHHFGTRNDAPPDENFRFGKKGNYDISAEECLRPVMVDKMGALAAEHAEKRYLSSKREPLGKSPDCPFPVPEKLTRNGFGMATRSSENAKNIIYSCGDREAAELHPPGAQRDRKYDWAKAGIDPTKHRFGAQFGEAADDTKGLLTPVQTETLLLPKITKDVQSLTHHEIGKSRNLGLGVRSTVDSTSAPAGKVVKTDGSDVRLLLSGHGTGDDDAYQRSVGQITCRSSTLRKLKDEDHNRSAQSGVNESARIFGVPTVRNDLPRPLFRKVTSSNNYGDDVGAGALIYPNRHIAKGIDEKYFTKPLTLDEVRGVATKCNFGLSDKQIEIAFQQSQMNGVTSIEAFKDTCYDLGF